jgi:YkoY family integral membrane protein
MSGQELLAGLSVIAGLVVLEGLLSVDNVLGIAALANELPQSQQRTAVRIGLGLAYLFRLVALLLASWLATNTWVRWVGAGYLLWLMSSHLTKGHAHDVADAVEHEVELEEAGERPAGHTAPAVPAAAGAGLAAVLVQIGLMDLSLSIDNVIAAVGLAPKTPAGDPVMWPIYVGVLIAILALQAIAPHAMNLLKRYPVLEPTAFVLIGYVGALLIIEEAAHLLLHAPLHVPPYAKFAGILLIILVALQYEADQTTRRIVRPLVHVSVPLMRGLARLVSVLMWPFTRTLSALTGGNA